MGEDLLHSGREPFLASLQFFENRRSLGSPAMAFVEFGQFFLLCGMLLLVVGQLRPGGVQLGIALLDLAGQFFVSAAETLDFGIQGFALTVEIAQLEPAPAAGS